MQQDTPFWLGVLGAVTGALALVVSAISAWYTRRQALASEGPRHPDVEVEYHGWEDGSPGWYRLNLTVRNRTNEAWDIVGARLRSPILGKLVSDDERPCVLTEFNEYDRTAIPLAQIDIHQLRAYTRVGRSVGPGGLPARHGGVGDTNYVSLFIRPSSVSRLTRRVSTILILEARADLVRHKDILVTRRLKATPSNPT